MEIYNKYMISNTLGFNINSAYNVLRDAAVNLDPRVIKHQFDLAQMTVLDETMRGSEYADMELVEFFEFLARVSYVMQTEPVEPTGVCAPTRRHTGQDLSHDFSA